MATPEYEELDPTQFEVVEQPEAVGTQGAAGPAAPEYEELDASQFEELPEYSNGLSAESAINKSPLTPEERLQLAQGNDKGRRAFLGKKFEAVQEDEDGNLIVQKGGLWHKVDANSFEGVDAWTATKGILKTVGSIGALTFSEKLAKKIASGNPVSEEGLSEYAEALPTAVGVAASVGAGIATGGASIAAQALGAGAAAAATTTLRTSLGRVEGTYDATPEEQIADIGFESLLNMGGVYVGAGIKPTAAFIAQKMPKFAQGLKEMPLKSRELIKNMYGKMNVGGDNIDELLENTTMVQSAMKRAAALSGGSDDEFAKVIARDNIGQVRAAADVSRQLQHEVYTKLEDELVRAVPMSFKGSMDDVATSVYSDAIKQGLGGIRVVGQNGQAASYSGSAALRIIEEHGGKLPKDASFMIRSQAQLAETFRRGGLDVADSALVDDTYKALRDFFGTMDTTIGSRAARGARGVKQMMKVSQVLDDVTFQLSEQGKESSVNSITRMMANYHGQVRQGVAGQFEKAGAGQAFEKINTGYAAMKRPLAALQKAARQSDKAGVDTALEQFVNRLGSRPGKSEAVKEGFEQALQVAEQYGLPSAKKLGEIQKQIRANNAARAFNPMIKPGLIGQGSATLAAGSLLTGNPMIAAKIAAGAVITSPKVAYGTTLAMKNMWAGKEFLEKLGADGVRKLGQNPEALNGFVSAIVQSTDLAQKTEETLMGQAQAVQQGQAPQGQ